jgi:hypothetical protein
MNAAVLGFKTWPWVFVSLTPLLMIFGDRVGRHGSSQTQTRGMFSYGGVLQLYQLPGFQTTMLLDTTRHQLGQLFELLLRNLNAAPRK